MRSIAAAMRALLTLVVATGGCTGWTAPVKQLDSVTPEQRRAILELPLFKEEELVGREHAVIDSIKGESCQYRGDDPPATETDATNEAQYAAKNRGADGIKQLKCDPPRGKTIFQPCWESISCTGLAIKFGK